MSTWKASSHEQLLKRKFRDQLKTFLGLSRASETRTMFHKAFRITVSGSSMVTMTLGIKSTDVWNKLQLPAPQWLCPINEPSVLLKWIIFLPSPPLLKALQTIMQLVLFMARKERQQSWSMHFKVRTSILNKQLIPHSRVKLFNRPSFTLRSKDKNQTCWRLKLANLSHQNSRKQLLKI
jgi:hypothetical protein